MDKYKKDKCRYCDTPLPETFLDLGTMPLANSFLTEEQAKQEEFTCPLNVTRCTTCGLVQLSHVVPAELMFSHYLYVSSTSATFRKHFADYATSVKKKAIKKNDLLAVDIGSNDGLLLSCFMKEGITPLGIEPAKNLSDEANKNGLNTINRYFDETSVDLIIEKYGKADIITGNNVFAHIDDSQAVCKNVFNLLSDTGMFVIEFPYLVTMYENMLFDMIYHEHLSYITLTSLKYLLNRYNLEIFSVDYVSSHGGSLRVFIQKQNGKYPISKQVNEMINHEENNKYDTQQKHNEFAENVQNVKQKLTEFIKRAQANGKTISGYGAPAKGNTLINYCNLNNQQIKYIVDDSPIKQSMLTPGAKIPVVSNSYQEKNPTDYIIVFAWNFAKEIINKMQHLKKRGVEFIVPLPSPTIV